MRFALSLVCTVCLLSACEPESPSPTTGMALHPDYDFPENDTVKVATWNLEHFVDAHDNPYIDAGRENQPEASQTSRVRRVARALRQLDADLVVLQETESEAFLQKMAPLLCRNRHEG